MPTAPENNSQLNKRTEVLVIRWQQTCCNKEKAAIRSHQIYYNKRQSKEEEKSIS